MMKERENVHWQDYVKKFFFVKVFFLIKGTLFIISQKHCLLEWYFGFFSCLILDAFS
jgi:hypothetical protein